MDVDVTFFTMANSAYFIGAVLLVNSLRLTGNLGKIVILDLGLTAGEREVLAQHAEVVDLPPEARVDASTHPFSIKPYAFVFKPKGVISLIDSDMIVTRSLDPLARVAARGKVCVFPDPPDGRSRWFAEWEEALELSHPPRRQTYVNAGFTMFSMEHWPGLLERWWKGCRQIPTDQVLGDQRNPFWAGDQDVLNAILMSEVSEDAIELMDPEGEIYPDVGLHAEVRDISRLESLQNGRDVYLIHHSMNPKVWQRRGWLRARSDAFARLMPRLLSGPDVPLKADVSGLPLWIRDYGLRGRASLRAIDVMHRASRLLPRSVRSKIQSFSTSAKTS